MKRIFVSILIFIFMFLNCKGIDFNINESEPERKTIYYVYGNATNFNLYYLASEILLEAHDAPLPFELIIAEELYPFLYIENLNINKTINACINDICISQYGLGIIELIGL